MIDIYKQLAAKIYGVQYKDVTSAQRKCVKSAFYFQLYSHGYKGGL